MPAFIQPGRPDDFSLFSLLCAAAAPPIRLHGLPLPGSVVFQLVALFRFIVSILYGIPSFLRLYGYIVTLFRGAASSGHSLFLYVDAFLFGLSFGYRSFRRGENHDRHCIVD